MKPNQSTKLKRAQKRVLDIKGFYNHLAVYIIIIGALFILQGKFNFILLSADAIGNPDFTKWLDWNFYGTPILWGIGLAFHAIKVFGNFSFFGKEWEERKIEEFLKNEN